LLKPASVEDDAGISEEVAALLNRELSNYSAVSKTVFDGETPAV
jgi:hypothetical protein